MMRCKWTFGLACACGLLWTLPALAQEKQPPDTRKPSETPSKAEDAKKPAAAQADAEKMAEMMKRCMEYATTGEHHNHLDPFVGQWGFQLRWWMSPDAEPQTSQGKAEFTWIYDGKYLRQDVTAPPEEPNGPPYNGLGLLGYDNMKKEYMSVWIDNMSTGMMYGTGKCDATGKVITITGAGPNPMTEQLDQKWRTVSRIESQDKHVFEMYMTQPDGKEIKQMEITYTRVK